MKYLILLALTVSTQSALATNVGYLIPVQQVVSGACDYPIREAVAKIAGPELLADIQLYKAGKTAKEPFQSCCGIENWPLFDVNDYSAEDVVWGELAIVSEETRYKDPEASPQINRDGSATFTVLNTISANVPNTKSGFTYSVVTRFKALPSSEGWMAKFSSKNPTQAECVSVIRRLGTHNEARK
jgi:hypothetical protein